MHGLRLASTGASCRLPGAVARLPPLSPEKAFSLGLAWCLRQLPFLELRGLGYSDEDLLALTAAFPYTGHEVVHRSFGLQSKAYHQTELSRLSCWRYGFGLHQQRIDDLLSPHEAELYASDPLGATGILERLDLGQNSKSHGLA